MKTIEEKINYYKDSLYTFDDDIEKYKFLLEQGKKAESFPEEFRQETFKVSGCQAQVWLVPYIKNKKINFYYDSDAFISKGMVTILCNIYGDRENAHSPKLNLNMGINLILSDLLEGLSFSFNSSYKSSFYFDDQNTHKSEPYTISNCTIIYIQSTLFNYLMNPYSTLQLGRISHRF